MTAPILTARVEERARGVAVKIAKTFREARVAKGDRQLDVAQYVGIREKEVGAFENRPALHMSLAKAVRMLNIYGLTLDVVPMEKGS